MTGLYAAAQPPPTHPPACPGCPECRSRDPDQAAAVRAERLKFMRTGKAYSDALARAAPPPIGVVEVPRELASSSVEFPLVVVCPATGTPDHLRVQVRTRPGLLYVVPDAVDLRAHAEALFSGREAWAEWVAAALVRAVYAVVNGEQTRLGRYGYQEVMPDTLVFVEAHVVQVEGHGVVATASWGNRR